MGPVIMPIPIADSQAPKTWDLSFGNFRATMEKTKGIIEFKIPETWIQALPKPYKNLMRTEKSRNS